MLRFSLLTLLGVVLVAAVGSAALANPTDTWRQVIVTGTVAILSVATLATVTKRSAFAAGFAVMGWLYFVLAFSRVLNVREHLLTERAVVWLHGKVHHDISEDLILPQLPGPGSPVVPLRYDSPRLTPAAFAGYNMSSPILSKVYNFAMIGRFLWTLLLATIGGLFASWLGRRRDRAEPQVGD
jgi:hypothetical protein